MKKIFLTVAVFALVFSACKKESSTKPSNLNYEMQTQNASSGLVLWNAGSANVASITFTSSTGTSYNTTVNKDVDLFSSLTTFGAVAVPVTSYTSPDYQINLQTNGTTSALHLTGTFNDGVATVPVTLDISDNVTLKAVKDVLAASSGANYTADFSIDLSVLMQGIAAADLTNAEQNGSITISSTSNNGIYQSIINNINGGSLVNVQIQ